MRLKASLLVTAVLVVTSTTASAGVIFTTRAAFLAAVGATPLIATEDFESFALGTVPTPLGIMGGFAEIGDTAPSITTASNTVGGPSPSQAWIGNVGSPGLMFITGPGGGATVFGALGFDYASELGGPWSFTHSLGTDLGAADPPGPPTMDKFIGWIGAPGEFLLSATAGGSGKIVDNMVAYGSSAVPEPGTAALFALALAGLGMRRRRS